MVLAVEKKQKSVLYDESSIHKVQPFDVRFSPSPPPLLLPLVIPADVHLTPPPPLCFRLSPSTIALASCTVAWDQTSGVCSVPISFSMCLCATCNCLTVTCAYAHAHARRLLVRRARKAAQQYQLVYGEGIPVSQLVQRIATIMQEYTQSG